MQWRVRLFDGPVLETATGEQIRRFRSRKVGALLAYLALHLGRHCPREELADAIWPEESDSRTVSNRLRVALASLRKQMEPPGVPFGSVLDVSMPGCVCLRSAAIWCDTAEADRAFRAGDAAAAMSCIAGTLLPGYFEDWACLERHRFDALSDGMPAPLERRAEPPVSAPRVPSPIAKSSLPMYLTRFFGREREIDLLEGLVESHRLVTVVGPGGMGKTRLAVEAATRLSFDAVFVALADIPSDGSVAEAVVRSMDASPSPSGDLIEQAASLLNQRSKPLLILDNAEHVLEGVASLILKLLPIAPELGVLVTSRQRLDIPGERILRLANLETPDPEVSAEAARSPAAMRLFVDRAQNARPDFVLADRFVPHVAEICRVVEGMPLAIELAAARVVSQSPAQIEESLRTGLIGLKSMQRGLSARHRSLRASISGSYDLLPADVQRFFADLSVFRGGWTSQAAARVAGTSEAERMLEELADRSLVVAQANVETSKVRYRFLEPIRQFAIESAADSGATQLASVHSNYYLELAERVSEDDVATFAALDEEQENLLAALQFGPSLEPDRYAGGLAGILTYAHVRGKHRTYRPYAEIADDVARGAPAIEVRVRLRAAAYFVLSYLGQMDAIRSLGQVMREDSATQEYPPGGVLAQIVLGYVEAQIGDPDRGLNLAEEALARARELGSRPLIWRSLRMVAFIAMTRGQLGETDPDEVPGLLEQAEKLSRECLSSLPSCSSHQTFEWLSLSHTLRLQGRFEESYQALKNAEAKAIEHGMESLLLFCMREECRYSIRKGAFERAGIVLGASKRILAETGYTDAVLRERSDFHAILLERLGSEKLAELIRIGSRMGSEEVVSLPFPESPEGTTR